MQESYSNFNEVTFIIRSVGERTERLLCKLLQSYGVDSRQIFIVSERPFSKALQKSFQIGIKENKVWTLCIDADVIPTKNGIRSLIKEGISSSEKVCEIQGFVLDKLFLTFRQAGNHLYRTCFLKYLIKLVPLSYSELRPETFILSEMEKEGINWIKVPIIFGLHDYEQSYGDIYRKAYIHANKHYSYKDYLLKIWNERSAKDRDYFFAIKGLMSGISQKNSIEIDSSKDYYKINESFKEKSKIRNSEWDNERINELISNFDTKHLPIRFSSPLARIKLENKVSTFVSKIEQIWLFYRRKKYKLFLFIIYLLYRKISSFFSRFVR